MEIEELAELLKETEPQHAAFAARTYMAEAKGIVIADAP